MYKGADEVLPGVRDIWKFYEMSRKIDNEIEIIKSPNTVILDNIRWYIRRFVLVLKSICPVLYNSL